MADLYASQRSRVDELARAIVSDLSGRGVLEILDFEPRKQYCIGVLSAPLDDSDPESSQRRARRFPDALGFGARVESASGVLHGSAEISFALYPRVVPTYSEQIAGQYLAQGGTQHLRHKYRRVEVRLDNVPFGVRIDAVGGKSVADTGAADNMLREICDRQREAMSAMTDIWPGATDFTLKSVSLSDEQSYRAAIPSELPSLPQWDPKLIVECAPSGDGYRLSVLLANRTRMAGMHAPQLFDVRFSVALEEGSFVPRPFAAAALDYRYETQSWGRGVNAVLRVEPQNNRAYADTVPLYEQPRSRPLSLGDALSPGRLASDTSLEALDSIELALQDYAEQWRLFCSEQSDGVQAACRADLAQFEDEIARFKLGLEALRVDPRLLRAFRLMNDATAGKGEPKEWYVFQVVFVVSIMPSLLARESPEARWRKDLEVADVLWYPTGGGKTEAYFSLILVAMFYDRLRGKKRGITAWLRYPLRMLSIQQLQRLAEFVVAAELVRQKQIPSDGDDSFSLGYYVGSANTPNTLTWKRPPHEINRLKAEADRNGGDLVRLRILQFCPYADCGSNDIRVEVRDALKELRLLHVCAKCGRGAPVHISDSEIYRYAPTVIVGTVDRLARAGQTEHFAHLYGRFTHRCPNHGYASFKGCVELGCGLGKRAFEPVDATHDPAPALLLQDELHLLKESLGTYDSHFEGFLDALSGSIGTHLPSKRIAATATIEDYERHIHQLYGCRARRFPSKGMQRDESAYAALDREAPVARVYYGILPAGLTTDQVAARVARAAEAFAAKTWRDSPNDETLNNCYDLSLVYVNLKEGLGNIAPELRANGLEVAPLSGERSLEQVRKVIDIVHADTKRPFSQRTKTIVATSIISHGVDLPRLNILAFSGFPGRAADYIQASSRVGRRNPGIVFTIFNPTMNLDRSTYAHFYEYHERLYQLVQPVPVNKYSEAAVSRTFTGIFSASLLNILGYEDDVNYIQGDRAVVGFANGVLSDGRSLEVLRNAYAIAPLPHDLGEKYTRLLERRCRKAHEDLEQGENWSSHQRLSPHPVASLREVQEQIEFQPDPGRIRDIEIIARGGRL
jgi:hypothetical protein